ncbi:hypothetical protein LTR93_011168 [Exophiala xenobiotica]|nr:hypothetical protein LTR93_011168 [Exophiala xenobiotica]
MDAESVSATYAAVKKRFVSNSVETFDFLTSVLYRGVWLCHREALQIMRDQPLDSEAYPSAGIHPTRAQRGAIVELSSTVSIQSIPKSTIYAAAKHALLALARSDAVDYAPDRVRVNCVLAGIFDTPVNKPSVEIEEYLDKVVVAKSEYKRL